MYQLRLRCCAPAAGPTKAHFVRRSGPAIQALCVCSVMIRHRVFLYITHEDQLLLLDHVEFPELKHQIPGGTVEPAEQPTTAALREAEEETGLSRLHIHAFLGDFQQDLSPYGRNEMIHAWFYHLGISDEPPIRWRHSEHYAHAGEESILFELYWAPLNDLPALGGIDGAKLPELRESLASNAT